MKRLLCLLLCAAGLAARAQDPATAASVPVQAAPVAPVVLPDAPQPTAADAAPAGGPAPASLPAPLPAPAPPPLVPSGRWEGDFTAGLSVSEGSTKSLSLQLGLDASYERPEDKLAVTGQYLESRTRSVSNGVPQTSVTALRWRLGGRYDRNFNGQDFGFVGLDFSHDQVQLLRLRSEPSLGLGRHLLRTRDDQWDVYAGLSYREDYYDDPGVEINGQLRTRYDSVDTLLGQESSHQLGERLRLKQKVVLYPGLLSTQGTRAQADAGLQLDLNRSLSLSVKLQLRYDAWAPAEKVDLLLLTGLGVKLGN